jgi:hypothetical protein
VVIHQAGELDVLSFRDHDTTNILADILSLGLYSSKSPDLSRDPTVINTFDVRFNMVGLVIEPAILEELFVLRVSKIGDFNPLSVSCNC